MAKKKDKNLGKTGVIIVAILLVGSTLAIGLHSLDDTSDPSIIEDKEKIEVNGYTFYYDSQEDTYSIFAKIADNKIYYIEDLREATTRFAFRENPQNLSEVYLEPGVVDKILNSNKIYLAYNPNSKNISRITVAGIEIARLTGNVFKISTVEAYTEDADPIDPNVPLRDCNDSTNSTTVLSLEVSNSTEILLDNGCVHVKGSTADELIKSADKLGMNLVGIEV